MPGVNFVSKVKSVKGSKTLCGVDSASVISADAKLETTKLDSESTYMPDIDSDFAIVFSEATSVSGFILNSVARCVLSSDTRPASGMESESCSKPDDKIGVVVSTELTDMLELYAALKLDSKEGVSSCEDADGKVVSALDCKAAMLLDVEPVIFGGLMFAATVGLFGVTIALVLNSVVGIFSRENVDVRSLSCLCSSSKSISDTDVDSRSELNFVFDSCNVSDGDSDIAIRSIFE